MKTKTILGLRFPNALAAVMALGLAMTGAAHASMLQFSYSQSGEHGIHFSFDQLSNPTPISHSDGYGWSAGYTQVSISHWSGNISPVSSIFWFAQPHGAAFSLGGGDSLAFFGLQGTDAQSVFTGSLTQPLFQTGTFTAGSDGWSWWEQGQRGTLTVTELDGTVPEPGSLALFAGALGLLGVAFWARRRARA